MITYIFIVYDLLDEFVLSDEFDLLDNDCQECLLTVVDALKIIIRKTFTKQDN